MPIIVKNPGGPVVGLDIGSNFIKACQAQVRGGRPEVTALAVLPTPTDAVSGTEIVDPVALGRALKQLLLQAGIKARKVVSSVAGQSSLVVRIIEVPKMTTKELQETMKWEVERHVPFAAEETVMDFQPLSAPEEVPDGQNMEVLLAVAQQGLLSKHIAALNAAGLAPRAIDIEALAASRPLVSLSDNGNPTGTVAVIDIGANTTDISIFRDGRIAFTRSIQIAGNSLTKAISDVLGQPLPQSERMKKELAAAPENASVASAFPTEVVDTGGFDFGMPGGETLSFDAPTADAGSASFDVAGSIGASPFTDTVDAPVAGAPPAAGAPAFDIGGLGSEPHAAAAPGAPGSTPDVFGAPPAGEVFGVPPEGDPFSGAAHGASPFDVPLAGPGDAGSLPVPTAGLTAGGSDPYVQQQVADAITPVLTELVTELRRSLDFYRNRASGQGVQRIIICGGTARLPGLDRFLSGNLDVPVVVGNALENVGISVRSDPEYLSEIAPIFPVSVGLAVRDMLFDAPPARARGQS